MAEAEKPGLRERKRQDTLQRITQAGLRLFGSNGYEATTIDDIAAAAGISRRTFFHYFKAKDDILISMQVGPGEQIVAALAKRSRGAKPLPAIHEAALRVVSAYPIDELTAIDRIMMSSESVQARKLASYAHDELMLFEGLKKYWPEESETELRLLAMLSIGIARLSLAAWRAEATKRPLSAHVTEAFEAVGTLVRQ